MTGDRDSRLWRMPTVVITDSGDYRRYGYRRIANADDGKHRAIKATEHVSGVGGWGGGISPPLASVLSGELQAIAGSPEVPE